MLWSCRKENHWISFQAVFVTAGKVPRSVNKEVWQLHLRQIIYSWYGRAVETCQGKLGGKR